MNINHGDGNRSLGGFNPNELISAVKSGQLDQVQKILEFGMNKCEQI